MNNHILKQLREKLILFFAANPDTAPTENITAAEIEQHRQKMLEVKQMLRDYVAGQDKGLH